MQKISTSRRCERRISSLVLPSRSEVCKTNSMDAPDKKPKSKKTARKGQLNTERELAKFYFFNGESQKNIAEKIGVSAQTVNRWAKEDNWESLRAAKTITRTEIVRNMLQQLNDRIVDGTLTADEAAKMAKAIKSLDGETNIITVIEVFTAYNKWLVTRMQFDEDLTPELVKAMNKYQDLYIAENLNATKVVGR